MARRRSRRLAKPLLPGLGFVIFILLLASTIWGLYWLFGSSIMVK
jgi:hypothetical protein